MGGKATNDLERLQIIEIMLMDQHKSPVEVAEKLGISRQRVWQIRKAAGINPHRKIDRVCANPECDNKFQSTRVKIRNGGGQYCGTPCYHTHRKGASNYLPCKYGLQKSRELIEEFLGFPLPDGFVVHHEDGNHRNWSFSNIYVFPSSSEHTKYHHTKRKGEGVLPYKSFRELPGKIEEWLMEGAVE